MSWANVASQPAKPQPLPSKAKKPGVLPPPTLIPSKPPVQLAPAPADNKVCQIRRNFDIFGEKAICNSKPMS
jgi:hypothetical protein